MPLPNRRSSSSSSSTRTSSGRDRLPPPTTMGTTNRWHSSTNRALNEWAARRANGATTRGGLPDNHQLVHSASVEVGAEEPLQVVDEGEYLLVWHCPVEVAVLVRYVAVERRDRRVDQLGHGEPPFTQLVGTVLRL